MTDIIDYYAEKLNRANYEIVFRTKDGLQVKRKRQVNMLGFWVGIFLLPFWGVGGILLLLTILDYILQSETMMFITVDQMLKQLQGDR